uniref:Phosphatidylserine synthase n=1 Tax=Angiostrongylus cantonensis TaxID=6313 RepID=A0A0K0DR10_ANGCA
THACVNTSRKYRRYVRFHDGFFRDIRSHRGRFKRAVMQFTPESWTEFDWFNSKAFRRTMAIYFFVLIWLLTELNTFFLKHVFAVDTKHPVVFGRIILMALVSAPSIRQYYLYSTDPLVKRIGMQSWVYCALTASEAAICVKFGRHMFPNLPIYPIIAWIAFLVRIFLYSNVHLCLWWGTNALLSFPGSNA